MGLLACFVELDFILESELALGPNAESRETFSGVRQKDAVENQACSLHGVFVHL